MSRQTQCNAGTRARHRLVKKVSASMAGFAWYMVPSTIGTTANNTGGVSKRPRKITLPDQESTLLCTLCRPQEVLEATNPTFTTQDKGQIGNRMLRTQPRRHPSLRARGRAFTFRKRCACARCLRLAASICVRTKVTERSPVPVLFCNSCRPSKKAWKDTSRCV